MKKVVIFIIFFTGLTIFTIGIYFNFKFCNVKIEAGSVVSIENFIRFGSSKSVKLLTDLKEFNLSKIGNYDIKLRYYGIKYNLKLNIVDTISPVIKVKNVSKPLNYQIDVNDFVVENLENIKLEYETSADTSKYGEYDVVIKGKDVVGNETILNTKLKISWVKGELDIQMGDVLSREMLVYDKNDINTILESDLKKINESSVGTYKIESQKDNLKEIITINKKKDETPPELLLKNVKTYLNKKVSKEDFIVKVSDNYSKVTTNLLTDIKNQLGSQEIQIEAVDLDNNKIIKTATLEIIEDKIGPVLSGLSKITINKGEKIDYRKNVSAIDDNYGSCEFEYRSEVDVNKYGTYYVYYTSSDKEGNKTTEKRIVVVNHDQNDLDELIKNTAKSLSSDVIEIRNYARNIKYSTNDGGSDPTWYGLVNRSGNCIVHAYVMDAILKEKGYQTKIIWTIDKTHYWNLVLLNGKWVHMDSTPSERHNKYDIMNDEMRFERLQGRDWDRDKWPKADWVSL